MSGSGAVERLRDEGQPIGDIYLRRDEIAARVTELGAEIAEAYAGRVPVLVAPLKSSAVFLADLSRALPLDHELDVIELAPYGSGRSGGGVRLLKDLDWPLAGRDVLLVEDVVDTGLTLGFLTRSFAELRHAHCDLVAPEVDVADGLPLFPEALHGARPTHEAIRSRYRCARRSMSRR